MQVPQQTSSIFVEGEAFSLDSLIIDQLQGELVGYVHLLALPVDTLVVAFLLINRMKFAVLDTRRANELADKNPHAHVVNSKQLECFIKAKIIGLKKNDFEIKSDTYPWRVWSESSVFDLCDVLIASSGSASEGTVMNGFTYDQIDSHSAVVGDELSVADWNTLILVLPLSYVYGLSCLYIALANKKSVLSIIGSGLPTIGQINHNDESVVSYCPLVPSHIRPIMKSGATLKKLFSHIKFLSFAGGHISLSECKLLKSSIGRPDQVLFVMYGSTEAFGRISCFQFDDKNRYPENYIGKLIGGITAVTSKSYQVECFKSEYNAICRYFCFSTTPNFRLAQNKFVPSDNLRLEADKLYFNSRSKSIIKLDGKRFTAGEIEEVCRQSGVLDNIAVLSDEDTCQIFVETFDQTVTEPLLQKLRSVLGISGRGLRIGVYPDLPKLENGKLNLKALADGNW